MLAMNGNTEKDIIFLSMSSVHASKTTDLFRVTRVERYVRRRIELEPLHSHCTLDPLSSTIPDSSNRTCSVGISLSLQVPFEPCGTQLVW